jgi:hypothetical protein
MKRLLIVAALAMTTLSMAGCCRNPCRPGLFGGGGLFGHRWNRDNGRECCDVSYDMADSGCDSCGGGPYGGGPGSEVMLGPPPAVIGPPPGR